MQSPVFVEKQSQMSVWLDNLIEEDADKIGKLRVEPLIFPYTVKAGVGLEDVEMSIHSLSEVLILVRQAHIFDFPPVARTSLYITVQFRVETVFFDTPIQRNRQVKSITPGRAIILRKSVDCESDGIKLLLRIQRLALGINTPIGASKFLIYKMVGNIVFSASRSLQILRFWDNCCEKPDLPKLDETPLNFGYPILDGNRPVR